MKNRKAKILLTCRNARGVQQWLKLSNRRMGLFTNTADIVMCSLSCLKKNYLVSQILKLITNSLLFNAK